MYRAEYPRPNFVREEWLCLNGTWDFSFKGAESTRIEVPFVFQCPLSGIGDNRLCDYVTYSRKFKRPPGWEGRRIMLRFGAVDYECRVYVNGKYVGGHIGGSCGFGFDITDHLTGKEESLRVEVYDPCLDQNIPRGKQYWKERPEAIWYTRSTGIWQTVWLEPVPEISIQSLKFTPNVDSGTVEVEYALEGDASGSQLEFSITMDDNAVASISLGINKNHGKFTVDIFQNDISRSNFHGSGWCWSPKNPRLFTVNAVLSKNGTAQDRVSSYFGMRKIETRNGRIYLNNRPYTQKLVLDQGYWPESLMTAPSDEALKQDILLAKEMGFNGCRKHQKSEDPRFLYWADVLGYLVYVEIPSAVAFNAQSAGASINEWLEIVARDYNSPSIVAWVTLNESWGVPNVGIDPQQQDYSLTLYHLLKTLDKTRLVVGNDGW